MRAVLDLHAEVERLSAAFVHVTGEPIALHSGINSGLVVTEDVEFDNAKNGPTGDTVNVASRLAGLAAEGEILIGPLTCKLTEGRVLVKDHGAHSLKGKSEPMPVARVVALAPRATTRRVVATSFVGRHRELSDLLSAMASLRRGVGSVIAVSAEAGGGKSRLVEELRLRSPNDVRWLEGHSYAYVERIPFFPVMNLISRALEIDEADTPETIAAKLERGILGLGLGHSALGVIARLYEIDMTKGVSIDREAFQPLLLSCVAQLVTAIATAAPTVVCVQDLHWADPSTVRMLSELPRVVEAPVLMIVNYRPDFEFDVPGLKTVHLDELTPGETDELIAAMLDDTRPPVELVRFVGARTEGNPFFAEEIVTSLIETRILVRRADGWALQAQPADAAVPSTVQGVIAARIDRLDRSRRRVLQEASVVGREFYYSIVRRISACGDVLDDSLEGLTIADLIRRKETAPDIEYVFKHVLTQEVAYEGLLKSERRELHRRVGQAIEELLADRIPEFVETLAYHYTRSGMRDEAVRYLTSSGRKAVARYALDEANRYYGDAYDLLSDTERTPDQDRLLVRLLVDWALVHYYDGTMGQLLDLLDRHSSVAAAVGEPELLGMYLAWTGHALAWKMDLRGGLARLDEAIAIGEAHHLPVVVAYASAWKTMTLWMLGRVGQAKETGQRVVRLAMDVSGDPYPYLKATSMLAMSTLMAGDFGEARSLSEELVEYGARTGSARAEALGYQGLAVLHSLVLDPETAVEMSQAGVDAARDPLYKGFCLLWQTIFLMQGAQYAEARLAMRDLIGIWDVRSVEMLELPTRGVAASLDLVEGRLGRGMRGLTHEIEAARHLGAMWNANYMTVFLGQAYVSIVRREVTPTALSIARNPGFDIRHALPAARHAKRVLEDLRRETTQEKRAGWTALIALALAQLHASKKRFDDARRELDLCATFLENAASPSRRRQCSTSTACSPSARERRQARPGPESSRRLPETRNRFHSTADRCVIVSGMGWNGLGVGLSNLWRLADGESRSISPENFTGERGGGGRAVEGTGAPYAVGLGQGWKISPSVHHRARRRVRDGRHRGLGRDPAHLADADRRSGGHRSCGCTGTTIRSRRSSARSATSSRSDGAATPRSTRLAICVNPGSAFNCYWEMPFSSRARITLTNESTEQRTLYYQIDYTLCDVPDDAARFCAQFRRVNPLRQGRRRHRARRCAGPRALRRHGVLVGCQQRRLVGRRRGQVLHRRRHRLPDDLRHRHRGLLLRFVQLRRRRASTPSTPPRTPGCRSWCGRTATITRSSVSTSTGGTSPIRSDSATASG